MGALLSWFFSLFETDTVNPNDITPALQITDEFPHIVRFCESSIRELTQDDVEMQMEFIDAYFESTGEELAKLEAALEANDTQTVYIKSHSIKGAARYVGALKVAEHALKLEVLGRDNKIDRVRAGMDALKQELQDTEAELRKYKDRLANEKKHN